MKLYQFVNAWLIPSANLPFADDGIRFNTYSGYYRK